MSCIFRIADHADLTAAHAHVWEKLAAPGTWWNSSERLAIAEVVGAALDDPDPIPPWESASSSGRVASNALLSSELQDAVYRLAVHAGTLTEVVFKMRDATGITPQQWVEVIEVAINVAPIFRFLQLAGIERPAFPAAIKGDPPRQGQPSKPAKTSLGSSSPSRRYDTRTRSFFTMAYPPFLRLSVP